MTYEYIRVTYESHTDDIHDFAAITVDLAQMAIELATVAVAYIESH